MRSQARSEDLVTSADTADSLSEMMKQVPTRAVPRSLAMAPTHTPVNALTSRVHTFVHHGPRGEPSPGAYVERMSAIPVQMREGSRGTRLRHSVRCALQLKSAQK